LQETGRARALPSEPPKTGARTKKPQTLCGDCGFRRRVSTGFQTRSRITRDGMQYIDALA